MTRYGPSQGLADDGVRSILEDSAGNLWFGTHGGGVSRYDGGSFHTYRETEGLAHNVVWSLLEDRVGRLWMGTEGGVSVYDGHTFATFTTEQGVAGNSVYSILEDGNGRIWLGTNQGTSIYDGRSFRTLDPSHGLVSNWVLAMLEDRHRNIWFCTPSGVSVYDGSSLRTLTAEDGLGRSLVRSILEDTDGNIWFGTDGGGVSVLVGGLHAASGTSAFQTFTTAEGLPDNTVLSLVEDSRKRVWVGTDGGLVRLQVKSRDDGRLVLDDVRSYRQMDGLLKGLDGVQNSVYEDSRNRIWWGMGKGLTMLDLSTARDPDRPPRVQLNRLDIRDTAVDYRHLEESPEAWEGAVPVFDSVPSLSKCMAHLVWLPRVRGQSPAPAAPVHSLSHQLPPLRRPAQA